MRNGRAVLRRGREAMGDGSVWAEPEERGWYFWIEHVERVWHVSGLLCFLSVIQHPKRICQKNKLVVEEMSKYNCPEGIAGS